jgi:hypothetical protein
MEKFWHIINTPGTELVGQTATSFLIDLAFPAATIISILLLYFVMLGSKRANKILYWVVAIFIIYEMVVTSL